VVLVEGAELRIHVVPVLPGLGNHHQDRLGQLPARQHQELEGVVELRRVARALAHDRIQLLQIVPEQRRLHRALAGLHRVAIAAQGVDLAVVGDVAERVSQVPGGEGVGAVARVHERQRGDHLRIGEIRVEGLDLPRDQHSDVGDGAARQAGHVEEALVAHVGADGFLRDAADHVELALEGVLIVGASTLRLHEDLAEAGHRRASQPTDLIGNVGHVAPAEHALALRSHDARERLHLSRGGVLVL
jgi:hypothetical protein